MKLFELNQTGSHSKLLKQWLAAGTKHPEDPDDRHADLEDAIEASERRIHEYNEIKTNPKFDLTKYDYEIKDVPLFKLKHIQDALGLHHESMIEMAKQHLKSDYTKLHRKHDVLPILLNPDYEVLDGYHRIAAAVHNGESTVPALVPVGPGTGKVK